MNWSTEPPTTPGYYWVKYVAEGKSAVVHVANTAGELWMYIAGLSPGMRVAAAGEAQWYGPIQPPPDDTLHVTAHRIQGDLSILDGEVE